MAQNVHPTAATPGGASANAKDSMELSAPTNSHQVSKRLQRELMTLMTSNDKGISAFPEGDKLFTWLATVTGPDDSVYEGLKFKLRLEFPSGYPYTAPTVKFTTPCFHPNVDVHGNICLDILKEKWSALYEVRTILLSIQSLLGEPNNDSPLNLQAANLWPNQEAYRKRLHEKCDGSDGTKRQQQQQQQNGSSRQS